VLKSRSLITFTESCLNKTIAQAEINLEEVLIVPRDITALELFLLFQEKNVNIAFINDDTIKDKKGQLFFSKKDLIIDSKKSTTALILLGIVTMDDILQAILVGQLGEKASRSAINIYRTDILRLRPEEEDGRSPLNTKSPANYMNEYRPPEDDIGESQTRSLITGNKKGFDF